MSNRPDRSRGAILWLLFGGFAFIVGWFVGLVLLWDSRRWSVGQKLLGTLVVPLGLAGSLFVAQTMVGGGSERSCSFPHGARCVVVTRTLSSPGVLDIVGAVLIVIAPILVAFYLYRHRRNRLMAGPALV